MYSEPLFGWTPHKSRFLIPRKNRILTHHNKWSNCVVQRRFLIGYKSNFILIDEQNGRLGGLLWIRINSVSFGILQFWNTLSLTRGTISFHGKRPSASIGATIGIGFEMTSKTPGPFESFLTSVASVVSKDGLEKSAKNPYSKCTLLTCKAFHSYEFFCVPHSDVRIWNLFHNDHRWKGAPLWKWNLFTVFTKTRSFCKVNGGGDILCKLNRMRSTYFSFKCVPPTCVFPDVNL